MESSEGPISAEQVREIVIRIGMRPFWDVLITEELNALIRPLIESARDEGIIGDATMLFEEIARESDDKLTPDAQRLKRAMNAVVSKQLESAVASAQAEMRERCTTVKVLDEDGFSCDMPSAFREAVLALPLSPASDAWLRRVVEVAFEAGESFQMQRQAHWDHGDLPKPERKGYESILAEAAKEKP